MDTDTARRALAAWRHDFPVDPYLADGRLRAALGRALPPERLSLLEARASAFARDMTRVVGPAAARYEQRAHLPELVRYDGIGRRTESVAFDPAYDAAGGAVWASGLVALSGTPGSAFEQATLLYLLSLEGEAGHACPATCTIGLARALRRVADDVVRDRFLPPLVDPDYATAVRGSQFLTEVQGGSDVGANVCRAVPEADGTYRITGEKWFCSVADAGQVSSSPPASTERGPGRVAWAVSSSRGGRRRTERLRPPPPEGQARYARPGLGGDRLRWRAWPGPSARWSTGSGRRWASSSTPAAG